MFSTFLKRLRQQLVLLLVVALVVLAAYVSAGREFMPAVSRYANFFEQQISALTGLPVTIDSLTGSFQGFNPVITINGFSLLVGEQGAAVRNRPASALVFDSATLIVDVPRSIWQRRWVLADFVVESLEVDLEQTDSGAWRLTDVDMPAGQGVDLELGYRSFLRVSRLDLNDVRLNIRPRSGEGFTLTDTSATIQNLGNDHYLHVDTHLPGHDEVIAISVEVQGSRLEAVNGLLHLNLPVGDYAEIANMFTGERLQFARLDAGGDYWLGLEAGVINAFSATPVVAGLTMIANGGEPLAVSAVRGRMDLRQRRSDGPWRLKLSDMSIAWDEYEWSGFNVMAEYRSGQDFLLRADDLDMSLITGLALESGLLSDAARDQLLQYAPRGSLRNFQLEMPLSESPLTPLRLRSNIESGQVASVRGSPNLWGINGYVEMEFDSATRVATGRAEVVSDEFSINIPTVFTRTWDYDHVNGALDFVVDLNDGREVKLISSMIVAESEAVDARIKFTSILRDRPDVPREAQLELLVGASRVDSAYRALYLPDGDNVRQPLRGSMEWIERALRGGEVYSAGVIYRGSTIPGAPPATKTFQSFYRLRNGSLRFNDAWPSLNNMQADVITDDGNIDVQVFQARSLGVISSNVIGTVRRNEAGENWLVVDGLAEGAMESGLNYLQNAPVGEGLQSALAEWETEGDFDATISVRLPLGDPNPVPDVNLQFTMADNTLSIPQYSLDLNGLSGAFEYDSSAGLSSGELTASIFGEPATLSLSSGFTDSTLDTIFVDAALSTTPATLIAWPRQSEFVRKLLGRTEGRMGLDVRLALDQTGQAEMGSILTLDSSLEGLALSFPQPYRKPASTALPLHLELGFDGDRQLITGSLGDDLNFDLEMVGGTMRDGLLFAGGDIESFAALRDNSTEGLVVMGELPVLRVDQWTDFLAALASSSSASSEFTESVAFADLRTDVLELYEQELLDVDLRIEPDADTRSWAVSLDGDAIQGQVNIPYANNDYLRLELAYLHLPGDDDEAAVSVAPDGEPTTTPAEAGMPPAAAPAAAPVPPAIPFAERTDPLLDIDPRELPALRFATNDLSIGGRPFGSWIFTLDPIAEGVEVKDLHFDFRGLRLGMDDDESDVEPYFRWTFDGENHRSELRGILYADDMADVLRANGIAASLDSDRARFDADLSWPATPAFFAAPHLSGTLVIDIEDGRFQQSASGTGALKLISIINFDAIMRRLRFSDDLLRSGLAYDEVTANLTLDNGLVHIQDRMVISGPSSLYQITGDIDLAEETISGEMYVTLPVSDNIPWLGLLTANIPLAVGAYLFDRIFGDQVDSLTSAVYTLEGPWEGLEPEFKQAFGSPDDVPAANQ